MTAAEFFGLMRSRDTTRLDNGTAYGGSPAEFLQAALLVALLLLVVLAYGVAGLTEEEGKS